MNQVYQPIKEVRYICPVCGTYYKNEDACEKCIQTHEEEDTFCSVTLAHDDESVFTITPWHYSSRNIKCKPSLLPSAPGVITRHRAGSVVTWETFCRKSEIQAVTMKLLANAKSELESQLASLEECINNCCSITYEDQDKEQAK